jgi:hypothetical protein
MAKKLPFWESFMTVYWVPGSTYKNNTPFKKLFLRYIPLQDYTTIK